MLKIIRHFFQQNYLIDFNPAYNVSRQPIETSKYTTTTFAYHSTTYLFNANNRRRYEPGGTLKVCIGIDIKNDVLYLAKLSVEVSALLGESVGATLVVHLQLFNSFN